jgi:hypothetical protein
MERLQRKRDQRTESNTAERTQASQIRHRTGELIHIEQQKSQAIQTADTAWNRA